MTAHGKTSLEQIQVNGGWINVVAENMQSGKHILGCCWCNMLYILSTDENDVAWYGLWWLMLLDMVCDDCVLCVNRVIKGRERSPPTTCTAHQYCPPVLPTSAASSTRCLGHFDASPRATLKHQNELWAGLRRRGHECDPHPQVAHAWEGKNQKPYQCCIVWRALCANANDRGDSGTGGR